MLSAAGSPNWAIGLMRPIVRPRQVIHRTAAIQVLLKIENCDALIENRDALVENRDALVRKP